MPKEKLRMPRRATEWESQAVYSATKNKSVQQPIQKETRAILSTLTFFDIFDYPLTAFEIWRYLYQPDGERTALEKIIHELKNPELEKKIKFAQGFYFLKNREEIIKTRKERYLIAEEKLKKAKAFIRYLSHLPGVRGVAVSNTLALFNSKKEADIDLFLICRSHTAWSTRFWSVLPLEITGKRPKPGHTRDRFCLSFIVDEKNLDIFPWKNQKDIYYINWLATLLPVYDDGVFKNFWEENQWINKFLPNFEWPKTCARLSVNPSWQYPAPRSEKIFKKIQLRLMPQALKLAAEQNRTDVLIKNGVLKFHLNDNREKFQNQFDEKMRQIMNPEI